MSRLAGTLGQGPAASGAVSVSGSFFPQNDPDKEYNMPKDGTVHELTSNVGAARGVLGRGGDPTWPRATCTS